MILHRQGTQPRLIDSSEHSSINLNLRKRNFSKSKWGGAASSCRSVREPLQADLIELRFLKFRLILEGSLESINLG